MQAYKPLYNCIGDLGFWEVRGCLFGILDRKLIKRKQVEGSGWFAIEGGRPEALASPVPAVALEDHGIIPRGGRKAAPERFFVCY